MNNELTLSKAKEQVKEQEESISALINPEDLTFQDINSWDNADIDLLKDEIGMSMGDAWTYDINHPYGDMIKELAVSQYVDDMQRIPLKDLNSEKYPTVEDAIVEGYWPFAVSREKVEEIVWENMEEISFFHEYEYGIRMEIESAIIEARTQDLE